MFQQQAVSMFHAVQTAESQSSGIGWVHFRFLMHEIATPHTTAAAAQQVCYDFFSATCYSVL